jgi:hypothetical protein
LDNIAIAVKRVKDIYFSVGERNYIPDPSKVVKIELGPIIGFNLTHNLVNFILRIFFHYWGSADILVDLQVENIFEIGDLRRFANKDGIVVLPSHLITTIVGLSLSHGRALLLKNTAGTRWEDVVLPVTNPEEVAKHFFPYMFNVESMVTQAG